MPPCAGGMKVLQSEISKATKLGRLVSFLWWSEGWEASLSTFSFGGTFGRAKLSLGLPSFSAKVTSLASPMTPSKWSCLKPGWQRPVSYSTSVLFLCWLHRLDGSTGVLFLVGTFGRVKPCLGQPSLPAKVTLPACAISAAKWSCL